MAILERVFHILKIVLNNEDTALEESPMGMALYLVRKEGRLMVLIYHNMEYLSAE